MNATTPPEDALVARIAELEKRVRELEARPVYVYPGGGKNSYSTREEADRWALQNRIRGVRVVEQLP